MTSFSQGIKATATSGCNFSTFSDVTSLQRKREAILDDKYGMRMENIPGGEGGGAEFLH